MHELKISIRIHLGGVACISLLPAGSGPVVSEVSIPNMINCSSGNT